MTLDDLAHLSRIASVVILLGQGIFIWIMWSLRKQYVSHEHCEKQCKEHSDGRAVLEQRQGLLEQAQAEAPTGKDMSDLKDRLGEVAGDIKALRVTTQAQADAMQRIERPLNLLLEHELHGGK